MKISKIMTRRVVTVDMDDTLRAIKEIFDQVPFHHLLVVENGKLYGVISDRDLLKYLSPTLGTAAETSKDLLPLKKRAHQVMSRKPVALQEEDDIYKAIDIFIEQSISCLPVVDADNKPIGILSWRDILKVIAANQAKKKKKALSNNS